MLHDADLRAAAAHGFLLLPTRVPSGVELRGNVLRFDPELAPAKRAKLIEALTGVAGPSAN
jgi:hypothetical protein